MKKLLHVSGIVLGLVIGMAYMTVLACLGGDLIHEAIADDVRTLDREWFYAEAAWIEEADHFDCDPHVTFNENVCEPRKR